MIARCVRALDSTASLSVAQLLRRVGEGDRLAWEEIMLRFHGLVLRKVRSFRLQDADVHDVVQTTWLRLAENCHRIQFPERLGSWLATTAGRECLRVVADARRTPDHDSTAIENVADPSISPEQHVVDMDTARELRALVAELAPRKRHLLRVLFVDEPPAYVEVSRITGIPPGSIGPTRARALRQLRRKLGDNQLGDNQLEQAV